jgi:exodeoxyribonuclease VII large subunit
MLREVSNFSFFSLQSKKLSVREITRYIREKLESDYRLQGVWVEGEIADISQPSSGHLYFNLVDEEAVLRVVMWRSEVVQLERIPQSGEAVEVLGDVSVYDAGGQYQLYAREIRAAGEGERFQDFIKLKERLEAEGLFDPKRKRPLPEMPHRIGIVTSSTGAALMDVINVLRRRFPLVTLILSPTPVQGEGAPERIVQALQDLNAVSSPEVILVVRGGGSVEDLWAFNDEDVVRAVAGSHAPVVSGIGHDTDLILVDYAADVRAPTPSAAAEVATPDRVELQQDLQALVARMERAFKEQLDEANAELSEQFASLQWLSPRAKLANAKQRLDETELRMVLLLQNRLQLEQSQISGLTKTLQAVGPEEVLLRGYAIVTRKEDGALVNLIGQVSHGDQLEIRISDGTIDAHVTAKDRKKR